MVNSEQDTNDDSSSSSWVSSSSSTSSSSASSLSAVTLGGAERSRESRPIISSSPPPSSSNVVAPTVFATTTTTIAAVSNTTTSTISTSLDQERQILLLMLLAQVCALHDVTPKTFTVHVLELYERGILDPSSIHFLYDLGLVLPHPMIGTTGPTNHNTGDTNSNIHHNYSSSGHSNHRNNRNSSSPPRPLLLLSDEAANTTTTPSTTNPANSGTMIPSRVPLPPQHDCPPLDHLHQQQLQQQQQQQRAVETSAIRSSLEYHDQQHQRHQQQQHHHQQQHKSQSDRGDIHFHHSTSSWSVEEHPLSLSRYQREFKEIDRLASGSFGDVYRAINYMDGREYAIKCVSFQAVGYSNTAVQQVIREVHCLAVCDHPNIVRYYTSWLEPSWMTGNSRTMKTSHHRPLANNTTENSTNHDEYIQLITDLQSVISSGTSINKLEENLQSYFHDSSLLLRHPRRRSSFGGSICDDENDDDVDVLYQNNGSAVVDDRNTWKDTRDDISIDGYCPRNPRRPRQEYLDHVPYRSCTTSTSSTRRPDHVQKYTSPVLYQYQISLYIQMQLCNSSTLADWIRTRNEEHLVARTTLEDRIDNVITIFEQMVHGLHHVHEKNIIHRDLKPSNVFAAHIGDTPLHFKIGDFGLSKLIPSTHMDPFQSTAGRPTQWRRGRLQRQRQLLLLEPAEPHDAFSKSPDDETIQSDVKDSSWYHHHTAGVGTASYAAPEQVVTETYGTAVDIFSLGLILLELACCFSTEHERLQTFHKCRHQRIVPSEIHDKYPMMAETILNCTKPNPKQRPTAAKLKSIDLRQQSHIKDDIHFSNDLDHVLRPTPRVNGSSVEEMRKQLIDKEQQITELKLQLEIYQQELMRKDQMIESLSQSHSTGILDSTTMDKNEK